MCQCGAGTTEFTACNGLILISSYICVYTFELDPYVYGNAIGMLWDCHLFPFVFQTIFPLEDHMRATVYGNAIGDAIGLLSEFMTKDEAKTVSTQKLSLGSEGYGNNFLCDKSLQVQ